MKDLLTMLAVNKFAVTMKIPARDSYAICVTQMLIWPPSIPARRPLDSPVAAWLDRLLRHPKVH